MRYAPHMHSFGTSCLTCSPIRSLYIRLCGSRRARGKATTSAWFVRQCWRELSRKTPTSFHSRRRAGCTLVGRHPSVGGLSRPRSSRRVLVAMVSPQVHAPKGVPGVHAWSASECLPRMRASSECRFRPLPYFGVRSAWRVESLSSLRTCGLQGFFPGLPGGSTAPWPSQSPFLGSMYIAPNLSSVVAGGGSLPCYLGEVGGRRGARRNGRCLIWGLPRATLPPAEI